jgi:hypothetical protein
MGNPVGVARMSAAFTKLSEQIVTSYNSGRLATDIACNYNSSSQMAENYLKILLNLHKNKSIDITKVPLQPAFLELTDHKFFTLQGVFIKLIPKIKCDVHSMMACCARLVERGGQDLAATWPMIAFRDWCRVNISKISTIIRESQKGNHSAIQFLGVALEVKGDALVSLNFVKKFTDDRRRQAALSLTTISIARADSAKRILREIFDIFQLDPLDVNKSAAIFAAFHILK